MKRDLDCVRAAVGRVQSDLRRTLGSEWWCTLGDDWVLTVGDGLRKEAAGLSDEVEDEEWYLRPGQTPTERLEALADEASELIATEVAEILDVLEVAWPACPQHGRIMGNCSGLWLCEVASLNHEVEIGELAK